MNLRQTADFANKASEVQWVRWTHPNTAPANSSEEKRVNAVAAKLNPSHCAKCLNMNGCCFAEDKCPPSPLHENCHCKTEHIDSIAVTAECPIEKFTGYIFNDFYNNGKKQLFELWGYTISDSAALKAEMEKQAYCAYLASEYELGTLDRFGQRITICVTLIGKSRKNLSFKTGWMVYPNGKIVLSTPYGGKVK